MKGISQLCLMLVLLLSLCACGIQEESPPPALESPAVTIPADPNLGRYLCTSAVLDGIDLGSDGQWLELNSDGEALLYLGAEAEEATWTLNDAAFTLTIGREPVAAGTLVNGTLTVNLMGMDCIFVKETLPETPPAETPETVYTPSMGTFSCQGLYTVTYPLDAFQAPSDGLTDLTSPDGTKVWFTKLDTRADANQWRTDMESKLTDPTLLQWEKTELATGEYPAQVVIYETAEGWQTAVLVDFGRNRGSDGRSMAAACLYLSGPTREAVWNETIQSMVSSLKLGQ